MKQGRAVAVIPARYGSTRLPGKPLLKETGKEMIRHVYERVSRCRLIDRVVVATDDRRIADAVEAFGGNVAMTPKGCPSGTHRVAVAARRERCRYVVNVQGDEPEIPPSLVDRAVEMLRKGDEYVTLATPFPDDAKPEDPSKVKVVIDRKGYGLYFSRSAIPYGMDAEGGLLLHLGIYGYSKRFLERFISLPPSRIERSEKLEQLRALEMGFRIRVGIVRWKSPGGIDTMRDYRAFVERVRKGL
ncbi:MAG: 3-deoxy-D-manno-octulosonate cytidylyltransferase [Planctomycetes bacterium RBG_16_59_8]|nr:MAG: 3-deoxy-D-manno-octulosonate cytidylyltransferase [Planctomycetes bacterium RBG_16_59_8]